MREQIEIKNTDGKPIWYAEVLEDSIHLEYESYGHSDGGPDIESDITIEAIHYPAIREEFNFPVDYPITEVLKELSESGRGGFFKMWAYEKEIIKVNFVWYSFDD